MRITKHSIIGDVLRRDPGCGQLFLDIGMHCLGCPSATGETIAEACKIHGADADELVRKLNEYFKEK